MNPIRRHLSYANVVATVERANEQLEEAGATPLPENLTPHKLRHTFDQLGHTDPTFTFRVYRHGMRRDPESRARLAALVGAAEKAPTGTSGGLTDSAGVTKARGNA